MKLSQKGLLLGVAALAAANAQAGGLEKTTTWGAKYDGVGGIATSWVSGAESLYFNPAGLATKTGEHGDVSLNFSPTLSKFSGPASANNLDPDGKTSFSPVGGALVSYHPTKEWGIGVGYFVTGGTRAEFDNVNLNTTGVSVMPNLKSNLAITEFSVGTGYEVMPGLKVGAAWRLVHVGGDLDLVGSAPSALGGEAYYQNEGIGQTRANGFKVGVQYAPEKGVWGVGATYRNNVTFNADDTQTVYSLTNTQVGSAAGTVHAQLPWQATVGGYYKFANAWTGHLEYAFTDYSADNEIDVTGPVSQGFLVHWKDQSNYKIGVEYTGLPAYTLRAGYVYTTHVVPAGTAANTFSSPGMGNTITLGAGHMFADNVFEVNAALEYSFAKGDVSAADAAAGTTVAGTYKSQDFALHLSGTYNF